MRAATAAAIGAILYLFPAIGPFLAPGKWTPANQANFAGKIGFRALSCHTFPIRLQILIVGKHKQDAIMSEADLAAVAIVLVEPAGALNIGSVARAMKNMGLQRLILANPQCDPHGEEARRMAVHAGDLLAAAKTVPDLPAALVGCQRAIATTARSRALPTPLESPRVALPWLLEAGPTALIFGPEDRGLSNTELNYAQRFVGIPTSDAYPSMNLAAAVAVCAYELRQIALAPAGNPAPAPTAAEIGGIAPEDLASLDRLEGYYQHLQRVLLQIGFLYPHTAAARLEKFRRLYNRTGLSAEEVALLRGVLRQTEWAVRTGGATELSQDDRPS